MNQSILPQTSCLKNSTLSFVSYYFKVFSESGYRQFSRVPEDVKLRFDEKQGLLMMNAHVTERVAYLAMSLDGKIARSNGSVDWLDSYPGEAFGYEHFYESVDLILMGRKTYDWTLQFGAWPYSEKSVWVYSSSLGSATGRGDRLEWFLGAYG